jgi:hypothetical protein
VMNKAGIFCFKVDTCQSLGEADLCPVKHFHCDSLKHIYIYFVSSWQQFAWPLLSLRMWKKEKYLVCAAIKNICLGLSIIAHFLIRDLRMKQILHHIGQRQGFSSEVARLVAWYSDERLIVIENRMFLNILFF